MAGVARKARVVGALAALNVLAGLVFGVVLGWI
jgi:hypothetical protein